MKKGQTWWRCDKCGKSGSVDYDKHIGAWEGLQLIQEAHRAASSRCRFDRAEVRVSLQGPVPEEGH